MGWFSPLKGRYPSLGQIDKTVPVKDGSINSVKRGTILALVADASSPDGVWKVAGRQDMSLYVSLQDYVDPTAGFAGTAFDPKGGVPRITGICLSQKAEYQSSVFDRSVKYSIGDELTADNGIITKAAEGDHVFGVVTHTPFRRWVNNAIAVPNNGQDPRLAIRTGSSLFVLGFTVIKNSAAPGQSSGDDSSSDPGPEYTPTEDGGAVVDGETNDDGTFTVEGETNPDGTLTVNG